MRLSSSRGRCLFLGATTTLVFFSLRTSVDAFVLPPLHNTLPSPIAASSLTGISSRLYFKKNLYDPLPPPPPPSLLNKDVVVDSTSGTTFPFSMDDLFFQWPDLSTTNLDHLKDTLLNTIHDHQLPLASIQTTTILHNLQDAVQSLDDGALQQFYSFSEQLNTQWSLPSPQLQQPVVQFLSHALEQLPVSGEAPTLLLWSSFLLTFLLTRSVLEFGQLPPPVAPYPNNTYDPVAAARYFDTKPWSVLQRGLEIGLTSLVFAAQVLFLDQRMNTFDSQNNQTTTDHNNNDTERGRQLATLLTQLGPTFIKIGQSLSIRTDLLSPGYIRGLETLQDQVPPFDNECATRILKEQWNADLSSILEQEEVGEPVAAASLGQVYKATLKSTGQAVAIKVQRPDIMEQIALDMHLLRDFGGLVKALFNTNTDTVGTVDVWGAGFVDELDYLAEASNAELFQEQIAQTPLKDVVFAPKTVREYTTRNVLVTEWVEGERLDKSSSEDVTVLCSVAMNTYLTMLLELGILHCDPHPGNLLRTPEGKLCVLDWGMVSSLDKDLQLTMIEHVAHLTSADYKEVPRDLLLLGFVPQDKADVIDDSGVVEVLAGIYGAWTSGGGAAAVDVNQVVSQMQELTAKRGNIFQIPPYFAYIAKSFSVLEGIGLSNDPKYSIVNECLPYISRRLLTDHEKMGPALNTFIFGPEKTNENRIVDYRRVEQLVEGFGEYTTSASGAMLGKENLSRTELLDEAADQILDLVFAEEETPLQGILIEQMAKILASGSRTAWTELRERSGVLPSGRTRLGAFVDPLGLWRTSPLVRTNELDEKTIDTTRRLLRLFQEQIQKSDNLLFDLSTLTREEALALSSILSRKVWQRRRGVFQTSNRFARSLLELTANKLEHGERDTRRIEPRKQELAKEAPPVVVEQQMEEALPVGATSQKVQNARSLLTQVQNRESDRLARARRLLETLQKDDDDSTTPNVIKTTL